MARRIVGPCLVLLLWLVGWASAGQNTWTALGSLGSDINAIIPHPQDAGTLYAAGEDGVFRSIDGGEWISISEGLAASTVLSLVIDDEDSNRMYAGLNAGLYTSADGGLRWTFVDAVGPGVLSLAIGPGLVYAGTLGRGIFVSENAGVDWRTPAELSSSLIFDLTASPVDGTAYAATASGLYRTQDGGLSWNLVGFDLRDSSIRDIDLSKEDVETLFVATFGGGVFKSLDFGIHWTPLNQGLDDLSVRSIEVSRRDRLLYAATSTRGFYRSSDAGQSWDPVNDGLSSLTARTTYHADDPDQDRLFGAGPAAGVFEITFAPEPDIQLDAAILDFGEISVGVVQQLAVSISNSGDADLQISSLGTIRNGPFVAQADDVPFVIPAGESVDLEITFQPQEGGDETDTLTIHSDDLDSPELEVVLRGIGVKANLRVGGSGTGVDFGEVRVGETSDTTIVVTNTGNAAVVLSGASVDDDTFQVISFEPVEVQPLGSVFVRLRYSPVQPQSNATTLVILTTEPSQPRFEVPVLGTGTSPVIKVLPEELLFGNVNLGRDTRLLLSIANNGNADLRVTAFEIDGDAFRLERSVSQTNPIVVAPGGAQLLDVVFLPLISGAHRGTLTVVSDAPESRVEISLLGTGGALDLTPKDPVEAGTNPVDMIVLDVDADGDHDLAIIDETSIHIMLNDGTGAFPQVDRVAYPAADSPYSEWDAPVAIAAAPVFGHSPDLIVADQAGQVVSIVANDAEGGFSLERQDVFIGHAITAVMPLDVDADGDIDIAVADGDSPSITILLNNDGAGFNARTSIAVEDGPGALTAANLNDDGHIDLVVANEDAGTVSILLSDRRGGFASPRQDILVGIAPIALGVVDYDADGDNDIFSANAGSRDVTIIESDGDGVFSLGSRISTVMRPTGLSLSDLTRDVFADLVVSGDGNPFLSFFENDAGAEFTAKDVVPASAAALRVVIADMNGDGNNDIVSLSQASVRVFINEDTRVMDPPRPPTQVVAADVAQDLGRQIEITWNAPELDEQIGRTTEYLIFRADDADGPFIELGRRAAGERDFIEDAATLSQIFYYFVQAGSAALQSANSDTVSAASRPAPFFELELVNEPRISVGDTLKVRALLTPAVHDVAGISLYLTYDDSALTLIDADTTSAAMVPFRLDTTLTAGSLVENRLHPSTRDKIDVSLTSLQISNGVQPVALGEIWFRTLKDKTTPLTIDDEDALNRRSAVVEQVTGNWILPFIPRRQTQVSIRDFQVSGSLALEGRAADNLDLQATITLVDSVGGMLESPLNDEDAERSLIQSTLTVNGQFELNQIPRGSYRIFAKTPSHLQGQVVGDTVTIGDSLRTTLSFAWMRSDSTVTSILPAGDANDDNRVNLADYGLLVRHFDANSSDISVWDEAQLVDFNGDNFVNATDFFLLAQNFGEIGMGFSTTAAKRTTRGWVALDDDRVAIGVGGVGAIRGYSLKLSISGSVQQAGQPSIDALGGLFSGDDSMVNVWPVDGGSAVIVAVALLDPTKTMDGTGVLARLKATSPEGLAPSFQILDAEVLLADWSVANPEIHQARVLPTSTALRQNYPNPFNPSTVIPFELAPGDESSTMRLEVFNLLGQRIRTLVDARVRPGAHEISWDGRDREGRDVASGIYIYRLSIGSGEDASSVSASALVLSRRLLLLH